MRAKFIFEVCKEKEEEVCKLPVYYRTIFLSFLKEALSRYNEEYFKQLYFWKDKKNKCQKPFVFAVNLPSMKFERESVFFKGDILLNISSSDYEFFINIYNSLVQRDLYPYCLIDNFKIVLKRVYLVREPESFGPKVTFKTFSPILIEKKSDSKKVPVLPGDEEFEEIFNEIADFEVRNIRILRGGSRGLRERLIFRPIKVQKTIVKHRISEFVQNTGKDIMHLTCFSGLFELSGDPEDLKELYQNGIGMRRGQGFGFVEVVK